MRIHKKFGSTLIAISLSMVMAFPNIFSKVSAANKQDFLLSWFPLTDFTAQAVFSATDNNAANTAANLSLISDGKNLNIAHIAATTKTHHGYTSNNGWTATEKWWQMSNITTTDYRSISISFAMKSSATGPRDFLLQYSKDGETWFDASSNNEPVRLTMTTTFKYYGPYQLPEELDNCQSFYLRIYKEDDVSVDGKTIGSQGTNSITEIVIQGTPLKANERMILSEWYIDQAEAISNHNYYAGKDFSKDKPHFMATGGVFADTTSFWVTKINATTHLPQAINTSNNIIWFEGGLRYQGLEKDAFWIVELSSQGYKDLRIDWEMRCSAMAPADYRLQYSLNYDATSGELGDWHNINPALLLSGDIPFGNQRSRFTYNLPAALDNQQQFHLRLLVASNTAVNGTVDGVDKTNGAFHINNIFLTGTKTKEVEKQQLAEVQATPLEGSLEAGAFVELSHPTAGATIYYQINDGEILEYKTAIALSEKMLIGESRKIRITTWAESELYKNSEIKVYEYDLKLKENPGESGPEQPLVLPEIIVKLSSKFGTSDLWVEIFCSLPGVRIFYSINENPEQEYAGVPFTIDKALLPTNDGKIRIKVRGEKEGYQPSETVEYTFSNLNVNGVATGESSNWLLWVLMSLGLAVAGGQIYSMTKSKQRNREDDL